MLKVKCRNDGGYRARQIPQFFDFAVNNFLPKLVCILIHITAQFIVSPRKPRSKDDENDYKDEGVIHIVNLELVITIYQLLVCSTFKPIPAASHSDDSLRLTGILFNLLPQPAHMDVHGAAVADKIPAPDALEDEFAREHLSLMFGKEQQQVIFLRLERKRLFIQQYFAACKVDDQIPEREF